MTRILVATAFAIAVLTAGLLLLLAAPESSASGSISLIYVDTDISGTTISDIDTDGDTHLDSESVTLGPVDECREIAVDETVTIDIVAEDWPAGMKLVGVEFILNHDDSIIEQVDITGEYPLVESDPQGFSMLPIGRAPQSLAAAMIFPLDDADEDVDGLASSPGPLARIQFKGLAVGQSTISLETLGAFVVTLPEDGRYIPVDEVRNGFISVGQPCVPGSQPGPAPVPPGTPICAPGLPDADGDGYSNCAEDYMGTDWSSACYLSPLPGSGWPIDLVANQKVDISDVLGFRPGYWNQTLPRTDFDTDGEVTLLDWYPMFEHFSETCDDQPLPCSAQPWWSYPPPWPLPSGDDDCDGFSSSAEGTLGTDPNDDCGFTAGGDAASDTWPVDLIESNTITISDVLAMKPIFNQSVPPVSARYDLIPNGSINISDVLAIKPFFNDSCPP